MPNKLLPNIAVIGAGWYGCHLALALSKAGYRVTLIEKNSEIFSEVSGSFGIRLHAGPHYPRSKETRESCHRGFEKFKKVYPDLVIPHEYSIYALGTIDAEGNASKVDADTFKEVCEEFHFKSEINLDDFGYKEMQHAYNIEEPSIVLGEKLRRTFTSLLKSAGVKILCDYKVSLIEQDNNRCTLFLNNANHLTSMRFDKVINSTGYQSFIPDEENDCPFDMETYYQPCLALLYKDKYPGDKPFSFIVMDGSYPCLMPYIQEDEETPVKSRHYIMTHGKWTIMGAYESPELAHGILASIDDPLVANIKTSTEYEMQRFWPGFSDRFEYVGWKGQVIAKLKTRREFRSAVTYEKNNVIHIIPGKVSNIFDTEEEVLALLHHRKLRAKNNYWYISDGVLAQSQQEITEKPRPDEANTAHLKTYEELKLLQKQLEHILSQQQENQPLQVPEKNRLYTFFSSACTRPMPIQQNHTEDNPMDVTIGLLFSSTTVSFTVLSWSLSPLLSAVAVGTICAMFACLYLYHSLHQPKSTETMEDHAFKLESFMPECSASF